MRVFHVPLVALPLVLAACGGSTPTADPASPAADGDLATFCDAWLEVNELAGTGPDIDWESMTEEEAAEAEKTFMEETVFPVAERAIEAAPDADVAAAIETQKALIEEQGGAAFETEEFAEADTTVGAYVYAECPADESIEYEAVDYGYEGFPEEVSAGVVTLKLTNTGEEMHEVAHMVKKDGVTESWEDIMALPEEEAMSKVDFVGGAFAMPGQTVYGIHEFEAGEHAFVCFIPVGSTPDAEEGEGEEGPPHFTQGMIHEFTVTG
jgi:hypothetical protein